VFLLKTHALRCLIKVSLGKKWEKKERDICIYNISYIHYTTTYTYFNYRCLIVSIDLYNNSDRACFRLKHCNCNETNELAQFCFRVFVGIRGQGLTRTQDVAARSRTSASSPQSSPQSSILSFPFLSFPFLSFNPQSSTCECTWRIGRAARGRRAIEHVCNTLQTTGESPESQLDVTQKNEGARRPPHVMTSFLP
jgi:hypothetical protein